jgi:hypothetical protein
MATKQLPVWALPHMLLLIVGAVVLFPFRLIYEWITGRS